MVWFIKPRHAPGCLDAWLAGRGYLAAWLARGLAGCLAVWLAWLAGRGCLAAWLAGRGCPGWLGGAWRVGGPGRLVGLARWMVGRLPR